MKLYLSGHEDRYALEQLQLSLFPQEPMEYTTQPFSGDGAVSALHRGKTWLTATACITYGGKTHRASRRLAVEKETHSLRRRVLQQSYYLAALPFLAQPPAWGALAGVRPTKLTTRCLLAGDSPASAARRMETAYYVSPQRSRLCVDASLATVAAMEKLGKDDVSLYVGIPFCPTRCRYCSFVSQKAGDAQRLLAPFFDCLLQEVAYAGDRLAQTGCQVRTVYIGGGTPTTLSAGQLERLMAQIAKHFPLDRLIEYTVEAGRPDTLSPEKLQALRQGGATRVSINPQTLDDRILAAMGREHTAEQTLTAYRWAVEAGFTSINMDLIAGLPGDTVEGFARSLAGLLALGPSNITVHTLALKKGAALFADPKGLLTPEQVERILSNAAEALTGKGYRPYYLYRQKYMSGSFENIGWCRQGDMGLYNIYMMEELHHILALGGGGMSKLMLPGGKLERFHNPKFPQQYIDRFDGVLAQKDQFFARLAQEKKEAVSG